MSQDELKHEAATTHAKRAAKQGKNAAKNGIRAVEALVEEIEAPIEESVKQFPTSLVIGTALGIVGTIAVIRLSKLRQKLVEEGEQA